MLMIIISDQYRQAFIDRSPSDTMRLENLEADRWLS